MDDASALRAESPGENSRVEDSGARHRADPPDGSGDPSPPDVEPDASPFVEEQDDRDGSADSASDPGALAKVYEDELRLTDRARWNVAGSRARCDDCGKTMEPPGSIHTTLVVASEEELREKHPGVSELFARRDHCEECFDAAQAEHAFAYWKTSTVPPPRPPKRRLNLAAILAYFDYLDPSRDTKPGDMDEEEAENAPSAAETGLPPALGTSAQKLPPEEILRLRYLLGLLLVRKRVLRWVDRSPDRLTLRDPKTGREIAVAVPAESDDELASQKESFEDLFR